MRINQRTEAALAVLGSKRVAATAATVAALAAATFLFHPPSSQAAKTTGPVVSTAKTSLGRILVDSRGRTLYLFENDRKGKSACRGQCATFWPPLIASAKPRVAGGAKASLIGTSKRADGRLSHDRRERAVLAGAASHAHLRAPSRSLPSSG